ncbi:peptide/nickel transport system permease protein [Abditibacterium utsteinense]|uniref:Peptide/nickel transport system permease protein n=1 Tax=Abditibacterium utsteinense TaxID=1960156 RepID=A0A2S8ST17_9BACT|nr:ABC transporter permease [Abditibacterium utsteinense]PQV63926.1 peptide/nickel transport system permease protein [Abditibacterium utsteinense]
MKGALRVVTPVAISPSFFVEMRLALVFSFPMLKFILRRILAAIPLLLASTLLAFAVIQLAPGDFLTKFQGQPGIRQETLDAMREQFGLTQPWYVQYLKWLWNVLHGNFGYSFDKKAPVFTLIGQKVYYTLLLALTSMLMSWIIAIPLGVLIARKRNGFLDRFANFWAFAGISLPGFFMALLAMRYAQQTGYFPVGGATSAPSATSGGYESLSHWGKILDTGWHLFLPTLVLGVRGVAGLMRQMRGNILDVLGENYVLAARARGLSERKVIWKHAFRNSINPLITLLGYEISGLLAGAALVEAVMSWPGLGLMLLDAVQAEDLYLAVGSLVMGTILLITGNLIADILLAYADPRIRYDS